MSHEVTVYSTPTCPWCRKAKQLLTELKVPFTDHDVSVDRAARETMIKLVKVLAVPVTVIDGQPVVGFNEQKLRELLK